MSESLKKNNSLSLFESINQSIMDQTKARLRFHSLARELINIRASVFLWFFTNLFPGWQTDYLAEQEK